MDDKFLYKYELYKANNSLKQGTYFLEDLIKNNEIEYVSDLIGSYDRHTGLVREILTGEDFTIAIEVFKFDGKELNIVLENNVFAILKWPIRDQVVLTDEFKSYKDKHSNVKEYKDELRTLKGIKQSKIKEKNFNFKK